MRRKYPRRNLIVVLPRSLSVCFSMLVEFGVFRELRWTRTEGRALTIAFASSLGRQLRGHSSVPTQHVVPMHQRPHIAACNAINARRFVVKSAHRTCQSAVQCGMKKIPLQVSFQLAGGSYGACSRDLPCMEKRSALVPSAGSAHAVFFLS